MSRLSELPQDTLERLSASLDGALSPAEQAALEARLQRDPALQEMLNELREARAGLGMLPRLRAPRSFTLTPEMIGRRAGRPAYPSLRLATALAALGFVLAFGLDSYAIRFAALPAALRASAPAAEQRVEAPPEAPAEMMLQSAVAPEALSTPDEIDDMTGRTATGADATATAQPTPEDTFKAGAVGQETVEVPPAAPLEAEEAGQAPAATLAAALEEGAVVMPPTAAPPTATLEEGDLAQPPPAAPPAAAFDAEPEAQKRDAAEAEAAQPVPQDEYAAWAGWRLQPLRLAWTVLGGLTVLLGVLTVWARNRR